MNKRKIRDIIRFLQSILFSCIYIPHFLAYITSRRVKENVDADLDCISEFLSIKLNHTSHLLYELHNNRYFRNLFYYRIGPVVAATIGWWRPGDRYFLISYETKIKKGFHVIHPYATIINATSIGENFSCLHCTTLGQKCNGLPTIGDNVTLGANVTIIGPVCIGNNVIIGAGSVVVKNIPDNCVAVGNPCKPIKYLDEI